MPQGEWQTETAYEDKYALDAPGFAFEYLRRNRSFLHDQQRLERLLKRGTLTHKTREAFARRWGMRFREVRPKHRSTSDPVDNDSPSDCRSLDAGVDRIRPLSNAARQIPASLDRRANR